MFDGPRKPRLHITSIEEISPEFDHELAELFSEMRQATELSLEETASQLQTSPQTIKALEQGAIGQLPPWPETQNVVSRYADQLQLDADPMLRRIMLQLPPDHPRRPKTESVTTPSYDDVRSNMEAALNRVPDYHQPRETYRLPVQPRHPETSTGRAANIPSGIRPQPTAGTMPPHPRIERRPDQTARPPQSHQPEAVGINGQRAAQAPVRPATGHHPGYDDFRAVRPEPPAVTGPQKPRKAVQTKRKGGWLVLFIQIFLLLILLASGYAMWLATYDPQGLAQLKVSIGETISFAIEQIRNLIRSAGDGAVTGPS